MYIPLVKEEGGKSKNVSTAFSENISSKLLEIAFPLWPHSHHILMGGGGGGVGAPQGIFLGLKLWAKDIFLDLEKTPGLFWVLYLSSAEINNNTSATYCLCGLFVIKFAQPDTKSLRDFLGYAKKVGIFLGRQILKLGFFGF